jgi:hypothetical protein
MIEMGKQKTNLFWTGGWDSSFRLLQSLVVKKYIVQPHYIIDVHRHSLRNELLAMHKIKTEVFKKFPFTRELLLPTVYILKTDIIISDETKKAFALLSKDIPGTQYLWISNYSIALGINNLELSIEKDPICQHFKFMRKHLKEINIAGEMVFILDGQFSETPFYKLFHHFIFPIADITREEMAVVAKQYGFYSLMNLTWFCHTPLSNGRPCGVCTPCTQLFQGFNKNRLPKQSRLRYHFRYFLNPAVLKENYPLIYEKMKNLKHSIFRN